MGHTIPGGLVSGRAGPRPVTRAQGQEGGIISWKKNIFYRAGISKNTLKENFLQQKSSQVYSVATFTHSSVVPIRATAPHISGTYASALPLLTMMAAYCSMTGETTMQVSA
jgi:hypothetical protein